MQLLGVEEPVDPVVLVVRPGQSDVHLFATGQGLSHH